MFIEDYAMIANGVDGFDPEVMKFGYSCCLSSMRRNWFLICLSFADIHDEICCRELWRRAMLGLLAVSSLCIIMCV